MRRHKSGNSVIINFRVTKTLTPRRVELDCLQQDPLETTFRILDLQKKLRSEFEHLSNDSYIFNNLQPDSISSAVISSAALNKRLKGVLGEKEGITLHSFRVTLACDIRGLTNDVETVKTVIGWRTTKMAEHYSKGFKQSKICFQRNKKS